jgi:hypothetical protein
MPKEKQKTWEDFVIVDTTEKETYSRITEKVDNTGDLVSDIKEITKQQYLNESQTFVIAQLAGPAVVSQQSCSTSWISYTTKLFKNATNEYDINANK